MIFKVIIWAIAALLLIVPILVVSALFVNPKKEYTENSPYYRFLLDTTTASLIKILGIKVKVTGEEKLPESTRFLLVSNHRSNFDPIVTWYAFKKPKLAFVSKPENFRIPMYGRIIRKCCFLPIDRSDARKAMGTVNSAAALLKAGTVSVGIYPEGTRNTAQELLPFHNGVFKIAKRANVPVVIMSVSGTDRIRKNWYKRGSEVRLNILGVIPAEELTEMKTAQIGEITRELITDDLLKAV